MARNYDLLAIAFFLMSINVLTFILMKFEKVNAATHLMLLAYILGFTAAPLIGQNFISGILIYPLMISMAVFFIPTKKLRFLYAFLSILGCAVYIVFLKEDFQQYDNIDLLIELLISIGTLSCLFIVGYNYFYLISKSHEKIERNEQFISTKNEELEKYIESNMQLENFAHLASHELKTPLRNIQNFASLLHQKLSDRTNDAEKEMLNILSNQALEMDLLLKDLFNLTTVTNEPIAAEQIDTKDLLEEIIERDFKQNQECITIESLPSEMHAHKQFLKQLFENLIGNALKFIPKEKDASIRITGTEEQHNYRFSVIDNGLGISTDKKDKVFLIFKRLHNKTEYEGTGIGLAICKKIVERHEGKIWIEDNPEGGSIFNFTIAKNVA